jgi:hypothetical protein
MVVDLPTVTTWKIEDDRWVWYIDKSKPISTPFGPVARTTSTKNHQPIDLATLANPVTLDRTSVMLSQSDPEQVVTVSNHLPGVITLKLDSPPLEGITVELEKTDLKGGEKSTIRFRLTGNAGTAGIVKVTVSPLSRVLEIAVKSK